MATRKKNFTELEKQLLASGILPFKNVIENKQTDGSSVKKKSEAWEEIATKFNEFPQINEKATSKQLGRLWNNLKQRQRGELAKERQHRLATGGGGGIPDAQVDPVISMVAPNLLVEVTSAVDSDTMIEQQSSDVDCIEWEDTETVQAYSTLQLETSSAELTMPVETISPLSLTRQSEELPVSPPVIDFSAETPQQSNRKRTTSKSSDIKMELFKLESELRIKRNNQLLELDRHLYIERVAVEREKRREAKARADIAELELKRLRREIDD